MTQSPRCVAAALHELTIRDGQLVDRDGQLFDVAAYSRFKYGYTAPAEIYGTRLAQLFINKFPELARSDRRIFVTNAPYKFLPSASDSIAIAFRDALNCFRLPSGLEPAMTLHTIRFKVGSDSYAQASLAERRETYAAMPRHVDSELVNGAIIVFVDDVRITGETEKRFHELVLPHHPTDLCTLHVARVDEEEARKMPAIENVINKFRPPTLEAIAEDIATGKFTLNSRAFRTILEHDEDQLEPFLLSVSDDLLHQMFVALMNGTLEMFNRLPAGRETLHRVCRHRKLPLALLMQSHQDNLAHCQ